MQTFLPQTSSFVHIAQELDNKRLNKQVLEAWQLMLVLTSLNPQGEHRDPKGWRNHPAAKMWEGHEKALALYATTMCEGRHNSPFPRMQQILEEYLPLPTTQTSPLPTTVVSIDLNHTSTKAYK